jgi:hypothetical protein
MGNNLINVGEGERERESGREHNIHLIEYMHTKKKKAIKYDSVIKKCIESNNNKGRGEMMSL